MSQWTIKVLAKSVCQDEALRAQVRRRLDLSEDVFAKPELCLDANYLQEFLKGADVAVIGHQAISTSFLKANSSLQYLAKYGVGLDNVDFKACKDAAVEVLWKAGVNRWQVAEHTLGLILSSLRNITSSDRALRNGEWQRNGGQSLFGKTVGIVGFGHVGTALASLLRPFDVKLLFTDILNKKAESDEFAAKQVGLVELLKESSVVSVHVPLTSETKSFCHREWFAGMGEHSLFINASRGAVVDEKALLSFLTEKSFTSAACDVFEDEPCRNEDLLQHPRFIGTPHVAAHSIEARLAMVDSLCDRILEL